jgi:Coenzyme PQQ synthesis protein D (PqqD)
MTTTPDADTPFTAQVVHETIDDETVVIDLATGSYFSLEGPAALAWEGLASGEDVAATAARIADHETADANAVLAAVLGLHSDLHAAGLLRRPPVDRPGSTAGSPESTSGTPESTTDPLASPGRTSFSMPAIRRYDDMREHLLVDPIHEVERAEGWPAPLSH